MTMLPLEVQGTRTNIRPLLPLLFLPPKELQRVQALAADLWLAPEQLEDWLHTLQPGRPGLLAAQALHRWLMIKVRGSLSVTVAAALHQHEVEQRRDEIIMVNQPLEAADHFRADASIGPHRMDPELISYTVRDGSLDLFVREPDYFGGTEGLFRQVELQVGAGFRRGLLHDFRTHGEVMTGPEFQSKYPDHHLLQRKLLPATPFMKDDGQGHTELVILPERLSSFRWERFKETT